MGFRMVCERYGVVATCPTFDTVEDFNDHVQVVCGEVPKLTFTLRDRTWRDTDGTIVLVPEGDTEEIPAEPEADPFPLG